MLYTIHYISYRELSIVILLSVILAGAIIIVRPSRFDNVDPSSHHDQITLAKLIKTQLVETVFL